MRRPRSAVAQLSTFSGRDDWDYRRFGGKFIDAGLHRVCGKSLVLDNSKVISVRNLCGPMQR